MIIIPIHYERAVNKLSHKYNIQAISYHHSQFVKELQDSYDESLSTFLRQTRKTKNLGIHDYFFRNFETSFGFFQLRLCRVIDYDTGQTHRVLPDIAIPNATICIDVLDGSISTFNEWLLLHPSYQLFFIDMNWIAIRWKCREVILILDTHDK